MRHPAELHSSDIVWSKITLLVYSDDDAFRFLMRSTFRKLGTADVLSTGAAEDVPALMARGPSLVLVDFDGNAHAAMGALSSVRGVDADVPVLVAVKSSDRVVVNPAVNLGIEGIVPKPASAHELTLRVTETLKHPARVNRPPVLDAAPSPRPAAPAAAGPRPPAAARQAGAAGGHGMPPGAPHHTTTSGGFLEPAPTAAHAPPRRLGDDDLAPPAGARAGGRLSADDLALPLPPPPPAPIPPPPSAIEVLAAKAPAQYRLEPAEARRRKAQHAHDDWQSALEQAGHKKRKGRDVPQLDLTAIVEAHLLWLASQGNDGSRAKFQAMDLAGANLSRTVLANASFRESDLSDATLAESRLDGCDFRYAKLGAANFSGANLGVAQLRHADMRLANLEGAVLRGADLSGARLAGARMEGADLKGAILVGTDLREADLSGAESMAQAQIDKAVCDMSTRLPPGLTRPARDE
ncbi:MAG: pentapeptide repeat-containing protein [Solirubrobacterales bacterium]